MSYQMDPKQTKIAEKLIILNDRAIGMLTRIYNIKKACSEHKSKPSFFSDKSLDSAIKHIVRKFPVVDTRNNSSTFSHANSIKDDILKNLSLYYYTFADLLDLKDSILALLTLMDVCQCQLDICLNYELTATYLNLVVTLISIMYILSRVEDRKAVLGLFNVAYDLTHGQSEPSFPRLGQMILDYENPFKKLQEDFSPLNRVRDIQRPKKVFQLILTALQSISPVYLRRNVHAETWRNFQILSLIATPSQINFAAQTETIACEYLSLDVMDRWIICQILFRWIILSVLCCPSPLLADPVVSVLWAAACQMGLLLRIFRDESLLIHQTALSVFEGNKYFQKKINEPKENMAAAYQQCALIHMERRRFLRGAMRELVLMFKDQPGLLGPKILFVWMALSFSRDEVIWLLRHVEGWPSGGKKSSSMRGEDLVDRQLPELIHYMLELRELVVKHSNIVHNYYTQYVCGYDVHVTAELLSALSGQLSEDDATILSDFVRDLGSLGAESSLTALRLDWFRLQAKWSISSSGFRLQQNKKLAVVMNTSCFHLKMIDYISQTLKETSDLSSYCFFSNQLEAQWKSCIELPVQCRFSLAFARIAAHFPDSLHEMCPEEKSHVHEKALSICNTVLDDVSKAAVHVVSKLCEYELRLAEQTTASQVATRIAEQMATLALSRAKPGKVHPPTQTAETLLAGEESVRNDRNGLTFPDKLQTNLVELCAALNGVSSLRVCDHIFCPREYLTQQLENRFFQLVLTAVASTTLQPEGGGNGQQMPVPRRPSQLITIIQSYLAVFQNIDTCISIDMTRIFNRVLLQQTQMQDVRGRETLTAIYTKWYGIIYTKWYIEVVLRRASSGMILYTEHMQQMISASHPEMDSFAPEQFTDPHELRSLAQLMGPYGVKSLSEKICWHVASQIGELNKIVLQHRELLQRARTQFDQPEEMREVYAALCQHPKDAKDKNATSPAEQLLQRTIIIGEIFFFRDSLQSALRDVLKRRLPYLTSTFKLLHNSVPTEHVHGLSELAAALGEKVAVDVCLANSIEFQTRKLNREEHYHISCLLFTALAICLPRVASNPLSCYRPLLRVSMNNSHCLPLGLTTMAGALFYLHDKGDLHMRMREFLAIASSSILRSCREDVPQPRTASADEAVLPPILPILLDQIVQKSSALTSDELDACLPHDLILTAYRTAHQQEVGASS